MSELFGFLFVEFEEGQEVEVLRVGEFVDRHGKEVSVTDADLDTFVANFAAGEAGQDVPIDVNHERKEAAGWIKALSRAGDKLIAVPDWNELGKQLVGEKVYRYLSATIDLANKVIKSVSLVNFPAVKGLQPVELSEGVYTMGIKDSLVARIVQAVRAALSEDDQQGGDDSELMIRVEDGEVVLYSQDGSKILGRFPFGDGEEYADEEAARKAAEAREAEIKRITAQNSEEEDDMSDEEKARLREEIRQEILAEMAEKEEIKAELREQVRAEVKAELAAQFERRKEFAEFAAEVCAGESALAEKPEDVVAFLESVPEDQVELAQRMLKAKVVEFSERGSTGAGNDKKKLEGPYATQLRAWKQKGQSVAEFFELNEDILGKADEYDLSEFEKKEE